MYKITLKITLIISLLLNSTGQGYLCPEASAKGYALRPMATENSPNLEIILYGKEVTITKDVFVLVEDANNDDVESIAKLSQRLGEINIFPYDEDDIREQAKTWLQCPDKFIVKVCRIENRVAGYFVIAIVKKKGYIHHLVTEADKENMGIGSALVASGLLELEKRNIREFWPLSATLSSTRRILRRLGFYVTKNKDTTDEWIMHVSENFYPWLPSEEDLLSIGNAENAAVLYRVKPGNPILSMIQDISWPVWLSITLVSQGTVLEKPHLLYLAEKAGFSLEELLEYLELPASTESLVIVHARGSQKDRLVLVEEILHLLEGNPTSDERWQKSPKTFKRIREVVNEFLQLMFYPYDKVDEFPAGYSSWDNTERVALLKHYRNKPSYGPDLSLRKIIQKLKDDVDNNKKIQAGKTKIGIAELLVRKDGVSLGWDIEHLQIYLTILLERERFSKYNSLFLGMSKTKVTTSYPGSISRHITALINAAA